jgi:hypothetical protein
VGEASYVYFRIGLSAVEAAREPLAPVREQVLHQTLFRVLGITHAARATVALEITGKRGEFHSLD